MSLNEIRNFIEWIFFPGTLFKLVFFKHQSTQHAFFSMKKNPAEIANIRFAPNSTPAKMALPSSLPLRHHDDVTSKYFSCVVEQRSQNWGRTHCSHSCIAPCSVFSQLYSPTALCFHSCIAPQLYVFTAV